MGSNTIFDDVTPTQNQPQPVVSSAPSNTSTVFDSVEPSQPPQSSQSVPIQGTISAYTPTIWERIENMFREPARARRGDAAFRDNPEAGNRVIAPEAFHTESEKAEHPIRTGIGEFGGDLTSSENALQFVGMPALPRLLNAGFSLQMLYNAYKQYPAVKAAFDRGDASETERLLTHLVLGVGMATLAGQHAAKGESATTGKPTMYESAQAKLRQNESEEYFPTQPNPMAPKPAKRTILRPTTQTTAGVEAPISAAQQESPSLVTRMAGHLASPGAAREFQKTQTIPAASRQLVSTLGQRIEDLNNAHNALIAGEPAPEPVAGTQQASKYQTIDDAVQGAKQTVKQTWDRADAIDKREQAAYDQQHENALIEHQRLLAEHNNNVFEHNKNLAKGESPMEPIAFDESQVSLPERPRTLAELRSAEQQARANAQSADAAVRQQAYEKDLPKAEKDLDNWFRQHEDEISPEEWQSAKNVYRTASRMQEIANSLRGPMLKASETGSGLTGNTLRAIEARINNQAVRRGQSPDAFKQLLGPEAYDNWKNVARVLDPVKGPSRVEQGLEYFATTALAHFAPILAGAGIAGKAATEFIMNRVLFNPEWGKWFTKAYDDFKQTGQVAPEAQAKLQDLMKYTKMTDQELLDAGFTQEQIDAGVHLPGVGGGSQGADALAAVAQPSGQSASESADEYNFRRGAGPIEKIEPAAHPQGKEIADAFDEMKHNPSDPEVQKAYGAMKREIDAQWDHAVQSGFTFEPWNKEGQPYRNSKEMKQDVDQNHHLYFFRGVDMAADHPMAEVDPKTGLTYNEKFRAVHDLYGHATGGYEFGPKGEEAAYKTHAQMFSPEAIPALTSETRGQNNWVNFGKHLRDENGNIPAKGELGYIPPSQRPYAENKAGLLPKKFYQMPARFPETQTMRMHHFSDVEGLTETNPEFMGTAAAGAERARSKESGFQKRTYFGLDGYKEPRIQSKKFHYIADVDPTKYYDAQEDPEGIWQEGFREGGATGAEKAVRDAGYHGYRVGDTVASFEKVPVRPHEGEIELLNSDNTTNNASGESAASQEAISRSVSEKNQGISRVRILRNGQEIPLFGPDAVDARANKGETIVKRYADGREEIQDQGAGANYMGPKRAGTEAGAKADTGFMAQAKKNLPDASLSQQIQEAQRLKDAQTNFNDKEIPTRRPTAVGSNRGLQDLMHTNMDAINQADADDPSGMTQTGKPKLGYVEKMARTLADYDTGVRYTPQDLKNPKTVVNKFINHAASNLEWLYNQVPEGVREQTRQWYDSAHNNIVQPLAKQYGYAPEQVAGVIAALSPQNPWDNNVGLAKRMMDIYTNRQNVEFDPEMERISANLKKTTTSLRPMLRAIAGKKLSEITDPDPKVQAGLRSIWVRLYDEAHNAPANDQYSPTGEITGVSPDSRSWVGTDHTGKAILIMDNGSVENIHDVMSADGAHKIRNFYNNLINPNSANGHVTVDTHAVSAAMLQPFGGEDVPVMHNFGNSTKGVPGAPRNATTGLKGSYPVYAEAYRRAAEKLGVLPRELQSITWEAAKSLFDNKTPELKAKVREIWQQVQKGKLTLNDARERIKEESGGFKKPAWMSDEEWEKHLPESGDTEFGFGGNEMTQNPNQPSVVPRTETTKPGYRAEVGTVRRGSDGKEDVLTDVPLSRLKTPEGNKIYVQTVEKYIKSGGDYPSLESDLTINDGAHRIEAAKQRGDKTIRAWVRR